MPKGEVTVDETVIVTGMLDRNANALQLQAHVTIKFSIPPALFSAGMQMIVQQEINQAVTRLIERAKKEK